MKATLCPIPTTGLLRRSHALFCVENLVHIRFSGNESDLSDPENWGSLRPCDGSCSQKVELPKVVSDHIDAYFIGLDIRNLQDNYIGGQVNWVQDGIQFKASAVRFSRLGEDLLVEITETQMYVPHHPHEETCNTGEWKDTDMQVLSFPVTATKMQNIDVANWSSGDLSITFFKKPTVSADQVAATPV